MAIATKASIQTPKRANHPGKWFRGLVSGIEGVSRVVWGRRVTGPGCFVLLRPSRCGEDSYLVSEKALSNKWISLTASNNSSLVIDWLCDQVHDRDVAVAGLYCDYQAQEEQSTANMLGAILNQILERDGISEPMRREFRKGKRGFGGRAVELSGMVKMLKATITSVPEVFISIDGLDECLPKNRLELLESLRDIVQASPTTRVFLSGRPHIRDEIEKFFTGAIMILLTPTIGDIERFLKRRLDQDIMSRAMDDDLRAEIMNVIPIKISPM